MEHESRISESCNTHLVSRSRDVEGVREHISRWLESREEIVRYCVEGNGGERGNLGRHLCP